MGEVLKRRLKQKRFQSPAHEATLNLMVAGAHVAGMIDAACSEFGISHQQYNILRILRGVHPEGYPCGEIGVRMLDRAPDITRRLDGLEKGGYVGRDRLPEDRRVVITRITDKGLALLEAMEPRIKGVHEAFKKRLSNAECLEMSRLCEKLYDEP